MTYHLLNHLLKFSSTVHISGISCISLSSIYLLRVLLQTLKMTKSTALLIAGLWVRIPFKPDFVFQALFLGQRRLRRAVICYNAIS